MTKIIAVANQKGGVGKTTTAVSLAAALGLKGMNTLLLDIDPQGNATTGVGIDKRNVKFTSYDLFINDVPARDIILSTAFQSLYIMPSSIDLAAADIELSEKTNRESILKNSIIQVREDFDYIIIDCPPSLGLITINAICAADSILVPIQCEFFALEGLSQLMNTVRWVKRKHNPLIDIEGVLLTMYDGRLNLTQQVVDEVKRYFPRKVFATTIPRTVRLSEAPSYGKPIEYYEKNGKGSIAYQKLADEIIKNN